MTNELFPTGRQQTANSKAAYRQSRKSEPRSWLAIKNILLLADGPLTGREIDTRCVASCRGLPDSYRKCLHKMVQAGELVECETRDCTISGSKATTYARTTAAQRSVRQAKCRSNRTT